MKKNIIIGFLLIILCFFLTGFSCETRMVEVPVHGTSSTIIHVEDTGTSFLESDMVNVSDMVDEIIANSEFEEEDIKIIHLQGATFTITDHTSGDVVTTGTVDVSATDTRPKQELIDLSGTDLESIKGVVQSPDLNGAGVTEIDLAISPVGLNTRQLYYQVVGTCTSSPNFDIEIKVAVVVIALVEVEVPII
jgi:hypothetical protein